MQQIEQRAIQDLVPYGRNARTHSEAQITQIAASITEFGWTNPILVDGQGIIAGHGRLLAAVKLGMQTVPCLELAGLSEAQRRAYIIADNQLALSAGWDAELLKLELTDLQALDFDLDLLGFTGAELDSLLGPTSGLTDPDDVPAEPTEPVAALGDVWLCGRHRVGCGDSTSADDVGRLLAGVSPHLMVTDPPYGVEYDPKWRAEAGINKNKAKMGEVANDNRADWTEAWALFPGEVAYVWHADKFSRDVQNSLEACDFEVRSQIIWAKDRFALSRGHYHYQHEAAWYVVRKAAQGHWSGDRGQSTLWNIKARDDSGVGHGTQKPVECMRRPVENNSSPGQAVYDPFLGSGTTLIACEQTGRVCYGQELMPTYVDVCIMRWQNFTGQKAVRESDGRTYDETRGETEADIPEDRGGESRKARAQPNRAAAAG